MFAWFENLIDPFKPAENVQPPNKLGAFFLHYVRQIGPVLGAVMFTGLLAAIIEVSMFSFIGQIVDLLKTTEPARVFADHGWTLAWMALVVAVFRPVVFFVHSLLIHQAIEPNLTNLIRWQNHRYVLRQSLSFFQNDFAGRVATKVMQTGPALRSCVVSVVDAIWFVGMYTAGALYLFASNDVVLMIPLVIWLGAYVLVLWTFVPRIKTQAAVMSEARSTLTGRMVDSYTNIMTVKLFAHATREDAYAREAVQDHNSKFYKLLRLITAMNVTLAMVNGVVVVVTAGLAVWLWHTQAISLGAITVATGLIIRIINLSGWIMWVVTSLFEDIGTVENGVETISQPYEIVDRREARPLACAKAAIEFDNVTFNYGRPKGIIEQVSLKIEAGERVGLVGRSGAGKSTLVSLLLRFYDLEGGRICIDGQDIAGVTQASLRQNIGMVSQDTSLLHRSVRENILYGSTEADEKSVVRAARRAEAHSFILDLEDGEGVTGYEARVGERGVKLSGGQRQRIAIARVLLKDAPILILDEATSALDSEIEAEIQNQLYDLMTGKTVIAIAHRLSTIARMDRLVVLDKGHIIEIGSHDDLLKNGGLYAQLWARQSGGFLASDAAQ